MLPQFSEANVDAYLASIESSLSAINQFNTDLNANWVGAFQTRFTLSPANLDLLINFPGDGKAAILEAMAIVVRWANRSDTVLPIPMEILGFASQSAQMLAIENFKIKAEGGTYYDINNDMKFTVKKVSVEAKFTLC